MSRNRVDVHVPRPQVKEGVVRDEQGEVVYTYKRPQVGGGTGMRIRYPNQRQGREKRQREALEREQKVLERIRGGC